MTMKKQLLLTALLGFQLLACNNPAPEQPNNTRTEAPSNPAEEAPAPSTVAGEDWKASDKAYLQKGQTLLQEAEGDLNKDGIPDKVLVLENPANTPSLNGLSAPRTLLILQGNPAGQYRLWASSDKVVLCGECGGVLGDPFRTVAIEEGRIQLSQDGGSRERWERKSSLALHSASEEWMVVYDQMEVVDTYDASNNNQQNMLPEEQLSLEQYNVYEGQ